MTSSGSPGPFERNMPSGFIFSTSAAEVLYGITVTLQPLAFSERIILSLIPQSIATTLYFAFAVLEYQRFLQLTFATASCGTGEFFIISIALSVGVSASVITPQREPISRILRVSLRVSTPARPGILYSSMTSERVFV